MKLKFITVILKQVLILSLRSTLFYYARTYDGFWRYCFESQTKGAKRSFIYLGSLLYIKITMKINIEVYIITY